MKKLNFIVVILLVAMTNTFAQVGIGTDTPDPTSILDLTSTEKGFLPPRMTKVQRDAISSPAEGLVVYNLDEHCLNFWNATEWVSVCGGGVVAQNCGDDTVSFVYNGVQTTYGIVYSTKTGRCWLDRNLGASQVATSSTDAAAYGDLFQWGRSADGHQSRTSGTTTTQSGTDNPGHGLFISGVSPDFDWRNPANDDLWQGAGGINNPCPSGFRLPTAEELNKEMMKFPSKNSMGAFDSPLKLTVAGNKHPKFGTVMNEGNNGYYWSSTIQNPGKASRRLMIAPSEAAINFGNRAFGASVRCIKN